MSKFKIGDKIVCIETDSETLTANDITYGKEYLVQGTDGDGVDIISDTDDIQYVYNFRFKLAEEKEMEQTAEQIRNEILRIDTRIEEAKKDIENAENERISLVEKLREKGFVMTEPDNNSSTDIEVGDQVVITGYSEPHHDYSYVGFKGTVNANDHTDRPYRVYLDITDDSHWFAKSEVKKI